MRHLIALALFLLPRLLAAQAVPAELEAQLAAAVGRERLEILRQLGDDDLSENRYHEALGRYEEAIALAEELGEAGELAAALSGAGSSHRRLGDYPQAMEYYLRAAEVHEASGNLSGTAGIQNNLGIVYKDLGQYAEALESLERALAIHRQEGDDRGVARALNNLGSVYRRQGEFARALEHDLAALELKERAGDRRSAASSLHNIGADYRELGDLDRAMEYYRRSLEIKEELGDRRGIANTLKHIGTVERLRGDDRSSLATLERSLAIATEIDARYLVFEGYQEISATQAARGRFEEALAAFEQYAKVKEELFNQQSSRSIAEIKERFEAAERQKEIELLRQQQALATVQRNALLGGLALLALVILLAFNRYRLKLRAAHAIEQTNRELEHSLEEVEAKNTEMERLVYTVSHDLKSPLVTIGGFLGLVEKDAVRGDTGRLRKDLERIRSAAAKMGRLIDDLLDLSRIGRGPSEPEEVPMDELAREVVELLAGQITERQAEVVIASGLPPARGDRLRLGQLYQNLIANAVRFTNGQQTPRVEIDSRTVPGVGDSDEVIYTVRDNGVGIDRRDHKRIFRLFERLDPEQPGTGLGLAMARRIVEVHGGRIWVESEGLGRGSTFCFTLPGRSPPGAASGPQSSAGRGSAAPSRS